MEPPEIFTGEGNFGNWISHFESVAAINDIKITLAESEIDQKGSQPKSNLMLYKAEFETRRKKNRELGSF